MSPTAVNRNEGAAGAGAGEAETGDELLRPVTLEEELRRNPELREADVALLRDWADKQPHLPRLHDRELALFLHCCEYSLEAAKAKADYYYSTRTHFPEFFSQRDVSLPELQTAATVVGFVQLPGATPEGYRVILTRLTDVDPSRFVLADTMKLVMMAISLWVAKDGTAPGYVFVVDLAGTALGHVARLNPFVFKKFYSFLPEELPFRLKGVHFISLVSVVDKILAVMKPFMKKEIIDVLALHPGSMENFYKAVPKDILPEDYGGNAPSFMELHKTSQSLLLGSRKFFAEEDLRKVDEALRPGRARTAEDFFGLDGSFKKLDID